MLGQSNLAATEFGQGKIPHPEVGLSQDLRPPSLDCLHSWVLQRIRAAQASALNSSTFVGCSHVKVASSRPKCPNAAVEP